jgi:hypothetical protein
MNNPLEVLLGANWRTTILGQIIAVCYLLQTHPEKLPDPTVHSWISFIGWLLPAVAASAFGVVAKDKLVTGGTIDQNKRIERIVPLLIASLAILSFSGCAGSPYYLSGQKVGVSGDYDPSTKKLSGGNAFVEATFAPNPYYYRPEFKEVRPPVQFK